MNYPGLVSLLDSMTLAPVSRLALSVALVVSLLPQASAAQATAPELRALVRSLQEDRRGPFQAIRWFCPDGSVLAPRRRCSQPGGVQHGLLKDSVRALQG